MALRLLTLDLEQRIVAKTKSNGACLEWQNATQRGYGTMNIGGKLHRVHRLACELIHGEPTQERPHALHKCNNRLCVNPFHLYWGNDAMNARDRQAAGTAKGRNPSHCKWGHEFTEANTYWEPRGWGRACKACGIRRLGESRARAKARA